MINQNKMTAVEWLIQEHFGGIENCTPDFKHHIEQAKEMEKEQSLKVPSYDLDELAEKLLYKKYPYHPPSETGYWMDMYKEGFKKALELITFKSE